MGSRSREIQVTTHRGERELAVWVVEVEKWKLLPTEYEKNMIMWVVEVGK